MFSYAHDVGQRLLSVRVVLVVVLLHRSDAGREICGGLDRVRAIIDRLRDCKVFQLVRRKWLDCAGIACGGELFAHIGHPASIWMMANPQASVPFPFAANFEKIAWDSAAGRAFAGDRFAMARAVKPAGLGVYPSTGEVRLPLQAQDPVFACSGLSRDPDKPAASLMSAGLKRDLDVCPAGDMRHPVFDLRHVDMRDAGQVVFFIRGSQGGSQRPQFLGDSRAAWGRQGAAQRIREWMRDAPFFVSRAGLARDLAYRHLAPKNPEPLQRVSGALGIVHLGDVIVFVMCQTGADPYIARFVWRISVYRFAQDVICKGALGGL